MNNTFTNRPVTMNENKNLLEIEEHMYILDDVKKPNVFRNMFPYSEIPKIPFNDRTVPHDMPKDIWITDTTFRDGQQSRAPYSTEQIVTIYDYLHRLGGENGLIRASEFFLYSKKDRDAVYKCLEKGYKFPEITSWIRASKEDFKLVKEIGMKETGILVSCSDYHIFMKLKMTRKQAMEHYLSVIKECLEEGISPRCHLEDITQGRYLRICCSVLSGADEADEGISDSDQNPCLRYDGLRRQLCRVPLSREAYRESSMRCTRTRVFPTSCWNGTDTTISIRQLSIPRRHGCMAAPVSTPRCSVSASVPVIRLWKRWYLNMHSCAAR